MDAVSDGIIIFPLLYLNCRGEADRLNSLHRCFPFLLFARTHD